MAEHSNHHAALHAAPVGGLPIRPNPGRLPSLTELAARMSERSPAVSGASSISPSAARPRLATSLLNRTASSGQTPTSTTATQPPVEDAKHDSDTREKESDKEKVPRGYKNVPSLEAITERLALARAKSSEAPTSAGAVEEPREKDATEAVEQAVSEMTLSTAEDKAQGDTANDSLSDASESTRDSAPHPLQHTWTLFHDCKSVRPPLPAAEQTVPFSPPPTTETGAYEAGLTVIGEFGTVEGFCQYFNWLKPPSQLEKNSNYHLFKDGIKPMWEDEANANGGKWVLTMKGNPQLLDRCWSWLAMALVGEELDERDEVCGAVVSLRAKVDRIQLWLRSKDDIERINSIGKKLIKLLDVGSEPGVGLEFQYNTEERPTHTKFINIVPQYQSGFFRPRYAPPQGQEGVSSPAADQQQRPNQSPPSLPGAAGGFGGGMGSFSTGGSAWRGSSSGFKAGAAGGAGSTPRVVGGGLGGGVPLGVPRDGIPQPRLKPNGTGAGGA